MTRQKYATLQRIPAELAEDSTAMATFINLTRVAWYDRIPEGWTPVGIPEHKLVRAIVPTVIDSHAYRSWWWRLFHRRTVREIYDYDLRIVGECEQS